MKLTDENIELYLFQLKEGLLNAEEQATVEQALLEHPEWKEMADLYDPDMKLPAGASMPYENWKSLFNGGTLAKPISIAHSHNRRKVIPLLLSLTAAACLILFVTTIARIMNSAGTISQGSVTAALTTNTHNIIPIKILNSDKDNQVTRNEEEEEAQQETLKASKPMFIKPSSHDETTNEVMLATVDDEATIPLALEDNNVIIIPEPDTLPTPESINKENQKALYADNVIEWIDERTDPKTKTTPTTRKQQLRSLAKRATAVIANASASYEEYKEEIGGIIEDRIMSNQFLSNLVATLEDN